MTSVPALVLIYLTSMPFFADRTRALTQTALESGKPVVAVLLPGRAADGPRLILRELGCPYFDSTDDIAAAIGRHGLADRFTGCLVQEQAAPGLELILSVRNDPQFGPIAMVGAGGTLVELLHDVASGPAPLANADAARLVQNLRCSRLFASWRGRSPRDAEAVVSSLERLSWLAHDLGNRLVDLEINPLIVGEAGAGACAVDIRAQFREA